MTEIFTLHEFEAALPKPWWPISLYEEYAYEIEIPNGNRIFICSSVPRGACKCEDTGKNSIRHWLVGPTGDPIAPKLKGHTKRTKGWRDNMKASIRDLYKMGLCCKPCSCGKGRYTIFRRKDGERKGDLFLMCSACKAFKWLDEVIRG